MFSSNDEAPSSIERTSRLSRALVEVADLRLENEILRRRLREVTEQIRQLYPSEFDARGNLRESD